MTLETVDLSPCIGTEFRADATDLLSGAHSPQIRDVLGQTRAGAVSAGRLG